VQSAAVALAPLDTELRPFVQISRLLAGAGLVALVLAFALSWALSRRTMRPVRQLAAAAAAARRGDYDQKVEVHGGREVAELARTFNTLLADLREKREMETYIADLARSLPAPAFTLQSGGSSGGVVGPRTASQTASSTSDLRGEGAATAFATGSPGGALPPGGVGDERPAPRPGTVLAGRYEILSTLGRGGMGIVLQARDRDLDEIVALKLLRSEVATDRDVLERLKSEVRLARKITHANVLRTFDFLELDGIPCISMEYVHGVTLRALLARSERLPYSAGLHLARQLGAGLAAAHAEGVLHRDIKPENLILQQNGTAKLMDFGIARPLAGAKLGQTRDGTVVGTPHYLAPEQLSGGTVDTRADIYACGVLLYEVFTGRLPFTGETPFEILLKHVEADPVPPSVHWRDIPPELERILLRCLERSPENRFAGVVELLAAVERVRARPSVPQHA
jgi:HAMP domain-containing protein